MSQASPVNPRFQALMASLRAQTELQVESDDSGLLMQIGPYQLRVMPDGSNDEGLVIEVDLASAVDAPAPALALLHRINHVARFHHGWLLSLDEDERIVLHTQRRLARTNASQLQDLMASGLERAAAVAGLWHKALASLQSDPAAAVNRMNFEASAVRG